MQVALPLQKLARVLVTVMFLVGSIATVWQVHNKAYDDLPTFYWATHLAFNDGISAYQPPHFKQLGQSLNRKIYPFLYPPPSVVIFSPFLLGSYEHTKVVFTLCNLILWWLLTWSMYRLYCFYRGIKKHFLASVLVPLWSLCFMPIADTFRTGQVNLFVLACVMPLFFQSSRHRWQILSGALLAIAIMLKVYLVLGLLVLIMMGQKKILASTLAVLVLLCAASLFLLPWHMWVDWLALSGNGAAYGKQVPNMMTIPWNQSINGFFIRQFLDERILSGATYWHWPIYICSAALLAVTFYTLSKGLMDHIHGVSMAITLVFLTAIMVAPLAWLHHYVFAMPAVICCFALISELKTSQYKKIIAIAVLVAVMVMSFPSSVTMIFPTLAAWEIVYRTIPLNANLVVSAQLVGGIVFSGLFSVLILHRENL